MSTWGSSKRSATRRWHVQNRTGLFPGSKWASQICLAFFGLNIPILSNIMLVLAAAFSYARTRTRASFATKCSWFLLMTFLVSYSSIVVHYRFFTEWEAIRNAILIALGFATGYELTRFMSRLETKAVFNFILSIILGQVLFVVLNVSSEASLKAIILDSSRMGQDVWNVGWTINAPGLGAMASLGMCLSPPVILGFTGIERPIPARHLAIASILVIAGFATNLVLQNRAPFIEVLLAIFFSFLVYWAAQRKSSFVLVKAGFLIGLFSIVLWLLMDIENIMPSNITTYYRFVNEGVDSGGRINAWLISLNSFFDFPFGGRHAMIGGFHYVHNAWLDVWYDAGVVPCLLLVGFHTVSMNRLIGFLRRSDKTLVSLLIVSTAISILANMMQEPTLLASTVYFALSCSFFGFCLGLREISSFRFDKVRTTHSNRRRTVISANAETVDAKHN